MKRVAWVFALVVLGACSEPPETAEEEAAPDHVWKEQTDTLDKARGVQDTLDEANKKRREQLEDDGG